MSEETTIENLDSTNEEVQVDTEETTAPEGETPEAKLARLEKLNKQLYERTKKAEELAKQFKTKPLTEEKSKPAADFDTLIDNLSVVRDLAVEEINEMRTEAKNLNVDLIKYINSKAGKAHLNEFRSTKKAEQTTLPPSKRGVVIGGKPAEKILTDDSASKADKQAAFEQMIRARRGGNATI
jgi:hypothetical protein